MQSYNFLFTFRFHSKDLPMKHTLLFLLTLTYSACFSQVIGDFNTLKEAEATLNELADTIKLNHYGVVEYSQDLKVEGKSQSDLMSAVVRFFNHQRSLSAFSYSLISESSGTITGSGMFGYAARYKTVYFDAYYSVSVSVKEGLVSITLELVGMGSGPSSNVPAVPTNLLYPFYQSEEKTMQGVKEMQAALVYGGHLKINELLNRFKRAITN